MFRPRVIPCLLLQKDGLVKTIQFKDPTYVGDPINAVKIFNDAKADELIFVDIEASKTGRSINVDLVRKIGDEAFMPFAVGGGIRTIDQVKAVFNAGAEKVIINSAAIENPDLLKQAADIYGRQSIVASIDVKKVNGQYKVVGNSGTNSTNLDPVDLAKKYETVGAGELFINSIDRDGTKEGYDIALIKAIAEKVTIPVIACGGASDWSDFKKVVDEGMASAVSAGSIFVFIGRKRAVLINYPDREELEEIFE